MDDLNRQNFIPIHQQVTNYLREQILSGKIPLLGRVPPENEIALKFKINRMTVRKALSRLSYEGLIVRQKGKGTFVTEGKKNLRIEPETKKIIYILHDVPGSLESTVLKGMLDFLQPKGYDISLVYSENDYEKEKELLRKYINEKIMGIIFCPMFYDRNYSELQRLYNKGVHVVLLERMLKNHRFNYVGTDNVNGMKKGVEYLIDRGHKRIVFLGFKGVDNSATSDFVALERYKGYKKALTDRNIELDPELVLFADRPGRNTGAVEYDYIYKKIDSFLKKKKDFTAMVFQGDELAIAAYKIFREKGIKVPGDVSFVSFGDYTNELDRFEVPITAVKQDMYSVGYKSMELLFKRIEEKLKSKNTELLRDNFEKVLIKPELIERKSVKKIN